MLDTDDRQQIAATLALHAYVFDENRLDRIAELFTSDAVYDMSHSGMGVYEGIDAIRAAAARLAGSGHAPLAHLVTNIMITDSGPASAQVRSRGLMIMSDGSLHVVDHHDDVRLVEGRWLLSQRVIVPVGSSTQAAHAG